MSKYILASLAVACVGSVHADIIVDTLPANNQANLNPDVGQTFTTGVLSGNLLSTIEIEGPQVIRDGDPTGPFTLELWSDTDGDHSTWDPGVLIATSTNSESMFEGLITTFLFSNEVLSDNTVYGFTYTDGAGTRVAARMGLTNATAITDGTLFHEGAQVFSDAFDTAMRVTTVPAPASIVLPGVLGLAAFGRRRR